MTLAPDPVLDAPLPGELLINAWTLRGAASAGTDERAPKWGSGRGLPEPQQALDLGSVADPAQWTHPNVGYGILLPESDADKVSKAAGLDAEEPVRRLMAARPGTVMLRWDPTLRDGLIRRYFPDGSTQPPDRLAAYGTGAGRIPRYILIIGGPDQIPWSVQYTLSIRRAVGRLPLTGDALDNYITALIGGWPDDDVAVTSPLMWTVDLGDITAQMRSVIATPLASNLHDPRLPGFTHLLDSEATNAALLSALSDLHPALLVTSSHGMTEGAGDQLRAILGLPVDDDRAVIDLDRLDAAMPGGAIWHSQACCSAGSEGPSKYAGLLAGGSVALGVCTAVAQLGSTVAPAAVRMLGREHPIRAVVGHVEPTFDVTLRVAETQQGLGTDMVDALSTNLFAGQPLGLAFSAYRVTVGDLYAQYVEARDEFDLGNDAMRPRLTRLRISAFDRQSLVILGDPTVTLPGPPVISPGT